MRELEDELARLRRAIEDVDDTLSRRVQKLMARSRRENVAPESPESDDLPPSPPSHHSPSPLVEIRRRMRGY